MLVFVVTGEVDVDVGRDAYLVYLFLHVLSQFLQGGLIGHDGEGEVSLAVFALDGGRAPVLFDGGKLLELDDLAGGGGDGELLDVGNGGAIFFLEAYHDVVVFAVFFEIACVHAVDTVADVEGDGGAVEAMTGEFFFVEGDFELGAVFVAANLGVAGTGYIVHDLLAQLVGVGGGLVEVVAVDFDGE